MEGRARKKGVGGKGKEGREWREGGKDRERERVWGGVGPIL